jgi:hypothetical protein
MAIDYGPERVDGVITNNYGMNWLLVWNLDENGNTSSMSRPTIVSKDAPGSNAYTYTQLTAYKNGIWSEAMFTSVLYPNIRWIFTKASNPTNLPIIMQALLAGGNPATYMTINVEYTVTLDTTRSSVPIGGSTYQFMHNWGTGEAGDIPTFGKSGGYVWGTGMYWGQIDAYSNYGGLMNRTIAQVGATGGNTGDRLLVYVR